MTRAAAIVVQLSPRRWAVAVSDGTLSGVPLYEVVEAQHTSVVEAISAARRLRTDSKGGSTEHPGSA